MSGIAAGLIVLGVALLMILIFVLMTGPNDDPEPLDQDLQTDPGLEDLTDDDPKD